MKAVVVEGERVVAQFHGPDAHDVAARWISAQPGHEDGRFWLDVCRPEEDAHCAACGCLRGWVDADGRPSVWADHERKGGDPCVHGTRIPVRQALRMLADVVAGSRSLDDVLADYPTLSRESLSSVLRWASDRADESRAEAPWPGRSDA